MGYHALFGQDARKGAVVSVVRALVGANVVAILLLVVVFLRTSPPTPAQASRPEGASQAVRPVAASVPPFHDFTARLKSGAVLAVSSTVDCPTVKNAFLIQWCQLVISSDAIDLPTTGGKYTDKREILGGPGSSAHRERPIRMRPFRS